MASAKSQVATSSIVISDFILFPKLPKELRDHIWDSALPAPRVLKVWRECSLLVNEARQWARSPCDIDTSPIATPLLHVSREARAAALCRYEPSFKDLLFRGSIYFDYERDSLLFATYSSLKWFYGDSNLIRTPPPAAIHEWQARIRSVDVAGGEFESEAQTFILQCPLLKKLVIEVPRLNEGCWNHGIAGEISCIIKLLVKA
ncbi:hypothetical protein N431DRAFT_464191 [Stipitochalara longipes BDJ]|nr:hypothetical protein N431DRAFT_464191 [Stipitochalara longipes BDJ]